MTHEPYSMTILGRTIEHFGSQMYKQRPPAIAELVANCWDAGAKHVSVSIPPSERYVPSTSVITITDDGIGMTPDAVQREYLVVGRNKREHATGQTARMPMGRKGIGKLAGFGIANKVRVISWTAENEMATSFEMSLASLRANDGQSASIKFPRTDIPKGNDWSESGTTIELSDLRHEAALEPEVLAETLARRFSRTVKGEMSIQVNGSPVSEPQIECEQFAKENEQPEVIELADGNRVTFSYRFSKNPIRSNEMRGFVIYAHGRTAQAPPFFWGFRLSSGIRGLTAAG